LKRNEGSEFSGRLGIMDFIDEELEKKLVIWQNSKE
jgi:hypothetical protein